MLVLTTKTVRSMMYFLSIGGLLVCNGLIVMVVWNHVLADILHNTHELSFLEGTGITAFAYVIVFAVKYGKAARQPAVNGEMTVAKKCAEMTPDQRAALRSELVQNCGCKEAATK